MTPNQDPFMMAPVDTDPQLTEAPILNTPTQESVSEDIGQPAESLPPSEEFAAAAEGGEREGRQGPWTPVSLPEHMSPEDAYGAAKFFQSRYDKAQQELQNMQQMRPVVDAMLQDPSLGALVMNYLDAKVKGAPMPSAVPMQGMPQAPAQQAAPITLPDPPEDLYGEEGERWLRNMASAFKAQQQEISRLNNELREQQGRQQQTTQIEAAIQEAVYRYAHLGMGRSDAVEFTNRLQQNGLGVFSTVDQAAEYFMSQRKPSAQVVRQAQATERAMQRAQQRTPAAAAAVPSAGAPQPQNGLFVARDTGFDPFARI